jgi:hypothetical protein
MGAGPSDGADVQPFGGTGVDLSVAVTGYQDLGPMARVIALHEWRHEMLAMPHCEDGGQLDRVVDVRRLDSGPARSPNKSQIRGRHYAEGFLECGRGNDTL